MKIAGVMTGTSCDGMDISCLRFQSEKVCETLWSAEAPYPRELRERVLAAQLPGATLSLKDWGALNRDIGEWLGKAIARIIAKREQPDVLACHGQTVGHFPGRQGYTIQMAEAGRIAMATGMTTITQFREGDMAAGGQGAPLAPRFHQFMAECAAVDRIAIHNIGGISNLTYIDGGKVLAFDTGPGNCWIDAAAGAKGFDKDGEMARRGKPDLNVVEKVLRMKFFAARPPKSTGRDDFPFELMDGSADPVATATEITVESIARAYERFVPKVRAIYFCGGGAKNRFLLERIAERLRGVEVRRVEELGFDGQFVEAQAFAYLGYRVLLGQAVGGEWTGAKRWAPPAHITPGRNWREILPKLVRAGAAGREAFARSERRPKLSRK